MRVATKYVNLTRRFFAEHGVADYRIVESLGATEGAPAAGAAELIVDITTSGATLAANALKPLDDGVILRSQATLVASIGAPWGPAARASARAILDRIAASEEAQRTREIRARLPGPARRSWRRPANVSARSRPPARTPIRKASSSCIAPGPTRRNSPTGCWRKGPTASASPPSSRCSTPATRCSRGSRGGSAAANKRPERSSARALQPTPRIGAMGRRRHELQSVILKICASVSLIFSISLSMSCCMIWHS